MNVRLDKEVIEVGYDNLIHSINPSLNIFTVRLAGGQGLLKRGSALSLTENGTMYLLGTTETEGKANAILSDDIDTGESNTEEVVGAAYRTGHFNANMLITKDEYLLTAKDKENFRDVGILLSESY